MEKIILFSKKTIAALKDTSSLYKSAIFFSKIGLLPLAIFWFSHIIGFSFLQGITSFYLILFLPGYLLTPAILPKGTRIEVFGLSYLISIFLIPLAGYILLLRGIPFNEPSALISLHFLILLLTPIFIIFHSQIKKGPKEIENYSSLYLVIGIFVVLMLALLKIYPFLPEADPYTFYTVVEKLVTSGIHPRLDYRPFFSILIGYLNLVGKISIWNIMKYVLAFLPIFPLAIIWEYVRKNSTGAYIKFFLPILYLSVPTLFVEAEVIRPQIIFSAIFPIVLFFLYRSIQKKSLGLWFSIFVVSILSIKFHELGLFLVATSVASLPFTFKIKLEEIRLSEIVMGIMLLFFAENIATDFIASSLKTTSISLSYLTNFTSFRFWFLNNFTNIDGINVSWVGLDVFKYYSYFLGSAIPLILILGFSKNTLKKIFKADCVPFLASFSLFFAIAEILPRFNINFLPDRAWIFVSTALIFFLPPFLDKFSERFSQKKFITIMFIFIMISFSGTFYIVYTKQGYVTQKEYEAATYLKNNTPDNSLVVSQGGNNILIDFFGKRKIVTYRPIFYLSNSVSNEDLDVMQKSVRRSDQAREIYATLDDKLKASISKLSSENNIEKIGLLANDVIDLSKKVKEAKSKIVEEENLRENSPIYILYSLDKNKGLYSQRDWWRQANYSDANIAPLTKSTQLEKVFDNGNVLIWKVTLNN